MKNLITTLVLLFGYSTLLIAQTPSVENEKFVFLNNGTTLGMIIKSVLKADKQRLTLTEQQLPKAKQIITNAVVKYNDGVKTLKASKGMNNQKLRVLAIGIETEKAQAYKAILTKEQFEKLAAQHRKMYPESKI